MPREIFPNPTVKNVFFEIRFPNLFSIENKIGAYQERIQSKFPESKLILRRQVVFADVGPEGSLEALPDKAEAFRKKIWHFESPEKYEVNVTTNSLAIASTHHKTYNNPTSETKFRDMIDFAVSNFLDVVHIPTFKRIGLRYQDVCPLPNKNNETLSEYYNSSFPINRHSLSDAIGMYVEVRTKMNNHFLTYREKLIEKDGQFTIALDFDGYENNVQSENYLQITDELHGIIESKYYSTIKEPVKEHMRQERSE